MKNPSTTHKQDIRPPTELPAENALVHVFIGDNVQHLCKYQGGVFVSNQRGKLDRTLRWTKDQIRGWYLVRQSAPGLTPKGRK